MAASTFVAPPAGGAAPAGGCSGKATTYDSNGKVIDSATAPGPGGTASNPLRVDVNGSIAWQGSTTEVLQNGTYKVTASGITIKSGKVTNASGKTSSQGTEDLGKRLQKLPVAGWAAKTLKLTGTVEVKYTVTGEKGTCSGSVVLQLGDSPTFTPVWFGSVALFGVALFMLFWPAKAV
jgi:hypothetical protein